MVGSLRSPTPPRPPREHNNEAEQMIFEQRLCDDVQGIAIRKINSNGKANLRYIKCVAGSDLDSIASNRSTASLDRSKKYLVWGKKNQISLDQFTAVRKGKTTDRTKRNGCPGYRCLSLITSIPNLSLDIEAPTRLDRDKFARAFSRFLRVPLEEGDTRSTNSYSSANSNVNRPPQPPLKRGDSNNSARMTQTSQVSSSQNPSLNSSTTTQNVLSQVEDKKKKNDDDDDQSAVSSLTGGHGYDHDLVEELQTAVTELRMELDDARAEAARAVKVAEQAIQSAEQNRSTEWQNTVTHKAAEAAAMAQKRSAEAMKKQREAEERLEQEKEEAKYWRKQAEVSSEEAGVLQTRAAAAEIQRAVLEEKLESERKVLESKLELLQKRFEALDVEPGQDLALAMKHNRNLEIQLEAMRRELNSRPRFDENNENVEARGRKRLGFGRKKRSSSSIERTSLLSGHNQTSTSEEREPNLSEVIATDTLRKLQSESFEMRQQFELLRRETSDELKTLPKNAAIWGAEISASLAASTGEIERLRVKLAGESAARRKLLHEVQDLRGNVRVYCRTKPSDGEQSNVQVTSQGTIVLHRKSGDVTTPLAFEFDRVFEPTATQAELYLELEDILLGVLDGYRVALMSYGQSKSGKTFSLLGNIAIGQNDVTINQEGLQLLALERLFAISSQRRDRFTDLFTLTIAEVHEERLTDLLAGTAIGESRGKVHLSERSPTKKRRSKSDEDSSKGARLEIKTDIHGDTIVDGALRVDVRSYEDAIAIYKEVLQARKERLDSLGIDSDEYISSAHVIATLSVTSANRSTRGGSFGKLQFVDLAGADIVPGRPDSKPPSPVRESNILRGLAKNEELRFANKSLETLSEVVASRTQYTQSVPYRNSTLTHLIRDSLEGDTKVILLACVSSNPNDVQATASTLRFAANMRKVIIGKATQHTLSPP